MDTNATYYALRDVEAEVQEEGGAINRLVAVKGQPISPAYVDYVDEQDRTSDPNEARVAVLDRATSVRTKKENPEELDHEAFRQKVAAESGLGPVSEADGVGASERESAVNATSGAVELAAEEGVELSQISGTGKDGKVTVDDVRAHVEARDGTDA